VTSALSLEALGTAGESALLPMAEVARDCFPTWILAPEEAASVSVGRRIPWTGPSSAGAAVALLDASAEFLALAVDDAGTARYLAVFA
jgi:hypothetical protein